jgi:hypothetical protein
VELFAKAIETYPDQSDIGQISERIVWDTIQCEILNLDIGNNEQAKIFIALSKDFGLSATHAICGLSLTSEDLYKDLNRALAKEPLTSPLYKAGVAYLTLMSEGDIAGCYGGLLFLLAFALSRSSNFRSQSWGRRFVEIQRQLLTGHLLLNSLSEGSAREMSTLIDMKIRDGLDPEALSNEIRLIVNESFPHVPQLVAVSRQVEYKGLAPIQLIGRAMAERSEIPWDAVFSRFPALAEELTTTSQYITNIGADRHAGVKNGGVSQEIKNLLYFCVRSLIVLGGEESLRNYAGFGGDNSQSAVQMKITLDAIIDRLKERQIKMAGDINVDTTDAPTGVSYEARVRKIIGFTKSHGQEGSSPPPDDDNDDSPPGPSSRAAPPQLPEYSMDTTDFATGEVPSPDPDDDDGMSTRSSVSGTKRRATVQETPPQPSKRTTRAQTVPTIIPAFPIDERDQVTVVSCLETINQLVPTSVTEKVRRRDQIIGQLIWHVTDTLKANINISNTSDESYLKPITESISILGQGNANVVITHHPNPKLGLPKTNIIVPFSVINDLTVIQPNLYTIALGQLVIGLICTILKWGLKGTTTWNSEVIKKEATTGMLSYINRMIDLSPLFDQFYQECFQSFISRKTGVMLFDLTTIAPSYIQHQHIPG